MQHRVAVVNGRNGTIPQTSQLAHLTETHGNLASQVSFGHIQDDQLGVQMFKLVRPTIFASLIAPVFAAPAGAQSLTWWDILSPDRLIESITRYAVVLARTQVDLTFEDISTNLASNRTTISNLKVWPPVPWYDRGPCEVSFERITISGQTFDNLDNANVRVDAYDASVTPGCIPPEVWTGVERLELEDISFPSISVNVGYHIPSSGAKVSVLTSMSDVVEATIAADFDYIAFRGPRGQFDSQPIVVLSKASLELHNLGGWDAVSGYLPPAFTDEETAPAAVESALRSIFAELNRDGDDLSVLQLALISSVTTAWSEFLGSPDQIVLETNIAADRPIFLNFFEYEDNPSAVLRDLNPIMRAGMSPASMVLSKDALDAVLSGTWQDLPERERLDIGVAFAQGEGAPRNLALALDILSEIAEGGNADAAAAMSEALESADPETAYFWSLRAGAAHEDGASSRLDRLEAEFPLQTTLAIQRRASDGAQDDAVLPTSIVDIRARARDHLTGIGAHRSYQIAYTWASIGAALGDQASVAMGDEISKTLDAAEGAAAKTAVEELRAASGSAALGLWADLIPVLGSSGKSSATLSQRSDQSTAADGSEVADEELQMCHQLFAATLPEEYEVGGSCASNSAVLLRELALIRQQQGAVGGQVGQDLLNEAEAARDQLQAELAERAAVEAAVLSENDALKQELEAAAAAQSEGERQASFLNAQVSELRSQLSTLQSLLDAAADSDGAHQARVDALGAQLNVALARAASEERKRAELLQAEHDRLEKETERPPSDAEVLGQFRAGFLADLEGVLANRSDVTVDGDRLVFASGALFQPGSTTLSTTGRAQIAEVMGRFKNTSGQIPPSVDWIVRVDGHTDNVPISSSAFADNWELSQARALSVVRYLTDDLAIPPHRLAAVGFGEFRPANLAGTAAARAQNRRIELLVTLR